MARIIQEEGPACGLYLSPKSVIWSSLPYTMSHPDIFQFRREGYNVSDEKGIVLLGAPVGSVEFEAEVLKAKMAKVKDVIDLLHSLGDPHCQFALLRSCFSLPKISYLLCMVDCSRHLDIIRDMDERIIHSLKEILGCPLNE